MYSTASHTYKSPKVCTNILRAQAITVNTPPIWWKLHKASNNPLVPLLLFPTPHCYKVEERSRVFQTNSRTNESNKIPKRKQLHRRIQEKTSEVLQINTRRKNQLQSAGSRLMIASLIDYQNEQWCSNFKIDFYKSCEKNN